MPNACAAHSSARQQRMNRRSGSAETRVRTPPSRCECRGSSLFYLLWTTGSPCVSCSSGRRTGGCVRARFVCEARVYGPRRGRIALQVAGDDSRPMAARRERCEGCPSRALGPLRRGLRANAGRRCRGVRPSAVRRWRSFAEHTVADPDGLASWMPLPRMRWCRSVDDIARHLFREGCDLPADRMDVGRGRQRVAAAQRKSHTSGGSGATASAFGV